MKTATVRDLRNRYTSLLRWIRAGEEVVITRRGRAIARLVPEIADGEKRVDWSKSPAFRRERSSSRALSAEESQGIVRDAAGKW